MLDVLKNGKFPVVLTVFGFLLVVAGFFEIDDVTRLDIASKPSPVYAAVVIGLILIGAGIALFLIDERGSLLPRDLDTGPDVLPASVFLSAPMNTYVVSNRPDEYPRTREHLLALIAALKRECQIANVYYAGESIEEVDQFELPGAALKHDFGEIQKHEYFVLFWPEQFASRSSLVEMGIALTLDKKCLILTTDKRELPFLLQGAEHATSNVKIVRYEDPGDLPNVIRLNRDTILDFAPIAVEGAHGHL